MSTYKHLSKEERFYIHQSIREGKTQKAIAQHLGRSPSTISREIRRNTPSRCFIYVWDRAHWFACKQHQWKNKARKLTSDLQESIICLLKQYLSPEQISGYLKRTGQHYVSHETIYQFIYSDKARYRQLKPFLRMGHKSRRKRYGSPSRASTIPNRKPLSERPEAVENKTRIGDWECDTVIGKDRSSAIVTLVERKTLYFRAMKVKQKTAEQVADAVIHLLKPIKRKVKTITFDNGTEFHQHERIAKALNANTFFTDPYSAWQKGANENTNGLLRQFFPKGTNFNLITDKTLQSAVKLINYRPRKTREFFSPTELFLGIKPQLLTHVI